MDKPVLHTLVLDDDLELLTILQEVTMDLGHRVTAVSDSLAAVQAGSQQIFDIVITDIRMPGLDGLEALERLRVQNPTLKSLVITGYSSETDILRALRLGVGEYLNKPFHLKDLSRCLQRLADQVVAERLRQKQRHQLVELSLWAVEQEYRQHTGLAWKAQSSRLTRQILEQLGYTEETAAEASLALLNPHPGELNLPTRIARSLAGAMEAELPPLFLQAREAASALAGGLDPEQAPSPEIQAALIQLDKRSGPSPGPRRSQALALARALEQGQQNQQALEAYQQLCEGPLDREQVQAHLGLARLGKERADNARQALDRAAQLGPLSLAEVGIEAALYLADRQPEVAVERLEQLSQQAAQLGLEARAALAKLARACLTQQPLDRPALGVFCQPRHLDGLLDSCWWSLPYLFSPQAGEPGPELDSLLTTIVQERPGTLHRALQSGKFDSESKLRLLQFRAHPETLKLLAQDAHGPVQRAAAAHLNQGVVLPALPTLKIFTLGRAEVFVGERLLSEQTWKKNQKTLYLLVYLAAHPGRPVPEDVLCELFWPQEQAQGRRNLNAVFSLLRRGLGQDYVVRGPHGLQINPQLPWWQDYTEVQGLLAGDLTGVRTAVELCAGPFLEGCYLDFAVRWREQLEVRLVEAMVRLADHDLGQSSPESARELLEKALQLDSTHSRAYELLMRAQIQMGRGELALRTFERCQKELQRHLQIEPPIALLELYHRARLLT